jgi:RND family efflux transporter MFP subunit
MALFVSGLLTTQGCDDAPPRQEPPPPKVSVALPVVRPLVDYDQYNGWIEPAHSVEVRARVRGHIDKVHFADGQIVKKGDLLFELDPRPFEAEVGRQRDQKKIYEALQVAAKKEEARLRELLGRGGASQSQVDKAEADAASLDAQIHAAEQEIIRKGLDLEYSRITAPIDGRMSRALLTEGNLVNAGGSDPLLTTIVSISPAYIYFTVDERALQRYRKARMAGSEGGKSLKESQIAIRFGVDTDDGYPREAVMDFADNQVNRTTGTILVRATVDDPKGELIAGSRVRVRVPMSKEHSATLVPDTAILTDQDRRYVLVVGENNVIRRVDLRLGKLLDDGMRIVTPPSASAPALGAGDWIVVQGLQMARINYPVDPVRPTTQPASVAAVIP